MSEKRFAFVRGDVFDGLDYRLSPKLKVADRHLVYPIQGTLPGIDFDYSHGMRARLGLFFEILSNGIYGGDPRNKQKVNVGNGDGENDSFRAELMSEPDVIHFKKGIFREVKAFSPGKGVKLPDYQMEKYAKFQFNDLKIPPVLRFELFRHGIHRLIGTYKTSDLELLVSNLSQRVRFMVSIPFSVAYAVYDICPKGFSNRYEGEAHEWYTNFNSTGLNRLLAEPEILFEEIGLNPDDFNFKLKIFPKDVEINSCKISPFPVLIIKERDPYVQLCNLEERIVERKTRMREDYPKYDPLGSDEGNELIDENQLGFDKEKHIPF